MEKLIRTRNEGFGPSEPCESVGEVAARLLRRLEEGGPAGAGREVLPGGFESRSRYWRNELARRRSYRDVSEDEEAELVYEIEKNAIIEEFSGLAREIVLYAHGADPEKCAKLSGLLRERMFAYRLRKIEKGLMPGNFDLEQELIRWAFGTESAIELSFAIGVFKVVELGDPRYLELVRETEGRYREAGYLAAVGFEMLEPQPGLACEARGRSHEYRGDFELGVCACVAEPGSGDPESWGVGVQMVSKVLVECDGKDDHDGWENRTKDGRRARDIQMSGYPEMVRFTGSEVHGSPYRCALDAIEVALRRLPSAEEVAMRLDAKRLGMIRAHGARPPRTAQLPSRRIRGLLGSRSEQQADLG